MVSRLKWVLVGLIASLSLAVSADTFIYFAPVDGILKGSATDFHTTAATGVDVAATFTGTCNDTTFLRGDGACAAAGGGNTPGGSDFSTQYNDGAGAFGGAGPGSAGEVLTSNGAGMAPSFQSAASTTPGGSDTQLQYNNSSAFGGTTNLTWNGSKLTTPATGTGSAGLNLPHGTAPTSPANGDVWTTTAGMFVRVNGSTVGPLVDSGSAGVTQSTGNFSDSYVDACSSTPSITWNYVKTGDLVTLTMAQNTVTCTSDSTNFVGAVGSVPAAIRPANRSAEFLIGAINGGSATLACAQVSTAGTLTFTAATGSCIGASGTWQNTSNKGFPGGATGGYAITN